MNNSNQTNGVQHVNQDDFEAKVLKAAKPVLVDFYADWCGPCKMAAPILDDLAGEQSDVLIMKINVDENQAISQKYNVMSIPTVIVFNKGEEVDRQIGFAGRGGYEGMIEKVKGD